MKLWKSLIYLSILFYTSALFTNNNNDIRELDADEIMQVLDILSGMPDETSSTPNFITQNAVTDEQVENLTVNMSTATEVTTENLESSTFISSVEQITEASTIDEITTTTITTTTTTTVTEDLQVTTFTPSTTDEQVASTEQQPEESTIVELITEPTAVIKRLRRSPCKYENKSDYNSNERTGHHGVNHKGHGKSHKRKHGKNKAQNLPYSVERLLKDMPELNVTEPWEIDTEILYGPGNSIQIHINVTAMPKQTATKLMAPEFNYTASQIKHEKYWESVGESKWKAEEMEEQEARRKPLVPYPPLSTLEYIQQRRKTSPAIAVTAVPQITYPYAITLIKGSTTDSSESEKSED